MKLSSLLASLVVALPSVLAAVVPTSNNVGRSLTAPDADTVDVAARFTSSSESPARRQADTEQLTLQEIEEVLKQCQEENSTAYDCAKFGAVDAGYQKWDAQGWVWASVRSKHKAELSGKKNKDWFHIMLEVPANDGYIWNTGHIDFYVFRVGTLGSWANINDEGKSHIYYKPGPSQGPKWDDKSQMELATWK